LRCIRYQLRHKILPNFCHLCLFEILILICIFKLLRSQIWAFGKGIDFIKKSIHKVPISPISDFSFMSIFEIFLNEFKFIRGVVRLFITVNFFLYLHQKCLKVKKLSWFFYIIIIFCNKILAFPLIKTKL